MAFHVFWFSLVLISYFVQNLLTFISLKCVMRIIYIYFVIFSSTIELLLFEIVNEIFQLGLIRVSMYFGLVQFGSHISNFGFQLFQFGSDMYWILFVYILLIHSSTLLFNYYWLMLLWNVKVPGTKGVKLMNSNFQFRPIQFLLYLDSIRFGLVLVYFKFRFSYFGLVWINRPNDTPIGPPHLSQQARTSVTLPAF